MDNVSLIALTVHRSIAFLLNHVTSIVKSNLPQLPVLIADRNICQVHKHLTGFTTTVHGLCDCLSATVDDVLVAKSNYLNILIDMQSLDFISDV